MMWTIFVVLMLLWLLGNAVAVGSVIHILLVLAVVVILLQLINSNSA